MELGSSLRLLLRQWIVVVLGGLLTAGAAAYLYTSTPPTYRATAQLLLLLPSTAGDPEERTSAFLYLPSELNILARVVASVPASRDFAADLAASGLTSSYEVGVDPSSPVITVGAEGDDPDNVLATRDGLVEAVGEALARVQREERVPTDQTARIRVFAAETTPVELGGSGLRGVIAVLAAGGLLTLLTAFATDWLAEVRRRRRRATSTSTPRTPAPLASAPAAARAATPTQVTGPPPARAPARVPSSAPLDKRPAPAAAAPEARNGSAPTSGSVPRKPPPANAAPREQAPTNAAPREQAPTKAAPRKRAPTKAAPRKRAPSKKGSTRATPSKQASAEREPGERTPSADDKALASARGAGRP